MTGKHRKKVDPEYTKVREMSEKELEEKLQKLKDERDFPPKKGELK